MKSRTRKSCSWCGERKSLPEFVKCGRKRKAHCKECQRKASKERYWADASYRKHRSAQVARNVAKRRKKLRAIARAAKDRPCADCGGRFHYCAMDFDHVRGRKVADIARIVSGRGISARRLGSEIKKCDVVCANCHRVRTFNRR